MSEKKLRYALLLNVNRLAFWEKRVLHFLQETGQSELVLVVLRSDAEQPQPDQFISRFFRPLFLWRLYRKWRFGKIWESVLPLPSWAQKAPLLSVSPIESGKNRESFAETDIQKILSHSPDFILRFGFNILSGDILSLARFGIWSFHHGDPGKFRGGPPGFWEVFNGVEESGLVLQRLNEKLDAGLILRKARVSTCLHSVRENSRNLMMSGHQWPAQVVAEILALGDSPALHYCEPPSKGKFYTYPGNLMMIVFFVRTIFRRIRFHLADIFWMEKWNVALVSAESNHILWDSANWFPELPRGAFIADPFPLAGADGQLLAEYFSYRNGKGEIVKIDWKNLIIKDFFSRETHVSYPFNFKFFGTTMFVPEQSETHEIIGFDVCNPTKKTLFAGGFPGVDPTFFYKDGIWWLFATHGTEGPNSHLYLFFSQDIGKSFGMHPQSPVKIDAYGARPAGQIFEKDGKIMRPGQNCIGQYGRSVVWHEITELTPTAFNEIVTSETLPSRGQKYNLGIHTMNQVGEKWIIDAKRKEFSFFHTLSKLWRRLS